MDELLLLLQSYNFFLLLCKNGDVTISGSNGRRTSIVSVPVSCCDIPQVANCCL